MEKELNIAAILKDKPQGTKLYDWLHNIDVELDTISTTDTETVVWCTNETDNNTTCHRGYSEFGTERGYLHGLQILFPSKEMRDWEKLSWKMGDILVNKDGNAHVVFEGFDDDSYETFNGNNYLWINEGITMCFGEYEDELPTSDFSKANKEDAKEYIRKIEKRLGYKLNLETLGIAKQLFSAIAKEGKAWDAEKKQIVELKPKVELKPFDKVLVRDSESDKWRANLFGYISEDGYYYCVFASWIYCIPYIGNESLLGTTKDVEG